ncbi:MAG: hypothetical protein HY434_02690 [Candidatus Liptonbacteria bacterium]|nr:hypothetical protein [Candidatus Liptonbacteria bacterium]
MVDFLLDILIKALFGPWFFAIMSVEKVRGYLGDGYSFAGSFTLFLFVFVIVIALATGRGRWRSVGKSPKFSRFVINSLLVSAVTGTLGAFSNFLAIAFNNFEMPITVSGGRNSSVRLIWLTDWIDVNRWSLARFFWRYTWQDVSPGDLMLMISYLFLWWLILIVFCYAGFRGVRHFAKSLPY